MISRNNRFHGHGSLQYLYKRGSTVRSGQLALRYCPNPRRSSFRLAVVVSKKVSKHAVVRNRIRRRLYAEVRHISGQLDGTYDLAVLVYDEKVAALPPSQLGAEVGVLFKKAKIITPTPKTHAIVETKE